MVQVSWIADKNSTQDSYKLSYDEAERPTDTTSSIVDKTVVSKTLLNLYWLLYLTVSYCFKIPKVTLDALLPGRNYSISVQAVSNKAESTKVTIHQVTRPASPIIEDLKSIEKGLNISWKSDVNSRQEKFEVTHNRNDTGESVTTSTIESHIDLKDLYPGAGYEVKVVAISHGLKSEPNAHFQAVRE